MNKKQIALSAAGALVLGLSGCGATTSAPSPTLTSPTVTRTTIPQAWQDSQDRLEKQLLKTATKVDAQGVQRTDIPANSASCTVCPNGGGYWAQSEPKSVGGGNYDCTVTYSDGTQQEGIITVPPNGDFAEWLPQDQVPMK
jgi:hypothetical protein